MAKSFLVVGNWKMNPSTFAEAKTLASAFLRLSKTVKRTTLIIAPSFPHLGAVKMGKKLFCGAQDVFWGQSGAQTGEVSPLQLADQGVTHVIVGHSERRALGEDDGVVNKKARAVLKARMIPIICIGEPEHDLQGRYLSFLTEQIKSSLHGFSRADMGKSIIAYEPVWAIGKDADSAMDPHDLHETVLFIRKVLGELFGRGVAQLVPIIYGGSVKEENAAALMSDGAIAGFLVGGASLSLKTFAPIVKAVDSFRP